MPQKYFSFFKILKSQNFENSKIFWAPFLGPFFGLLFGFRGYFRNSFVAWGLTTSLSPDV